MIELLVVATIIIILVTLGLVSYRTAVGRSHQAKCESDLQSIRQALVMYRSENSTYPTTPSDVDQLVTFLQGQDYLASSDDFEAPPNNSYSLNDLSATTFTISASGDDCAGIEVTNP